ncbi:G-alpha-domain-containing protein [Rickenella mellea]|uniref:G-alpha-domain-containing protein n=1 Tax=Rickenella mellea TaxID=50990 RepID=A0A4Y7QLH1_9AGAM|nr:G-alpha-domain-containing protein [Rickenella mellea]
MTRPSPHRVSISSRITSRTEAGDPLSIALAPPPNESQDQRARRKALEAEAKRVSDEIDRQIDADAANLKRRRNTTKVLLLGQSESGKSTTLKNMQLTCAPKKWAAERGAWRVVIQLNLVRSVNVILDELGRHTELATRLSPLREVQKDLERRLGASAIEERFVPGLSPVNEDRDKRSSADRRRTECAVRSSEGWKAAVFKIRPSTATSRQSISLEEDETTRVIASCREEIHALWQDKAVKDAVWNRKVNLVDSAEFFLNHVHRVSRRDYVPSDDDIVRARLRTVGVQEHRINFEASLDSGRDLLVFDVGGSRTSRAAWPAYFDDVHAIIFLAPINCFDEKLAEDPRVNRLEDSFLLWKSVCANKLLSSAQLILFLNKMDLLDQKLKAGVKVKHYLTSFADRSNDRATVSKYLKNKFMDICRQESPSPRTPQVHLTSVVDTITTAHTLGYVQDSILKTHLRRVNLL